MHLPTDGLWVELARVHVVNVVLMVGWLVDCLVCLLLVGLQGTSPPKSSGWNLREFMLSIASSCLVGWLDGCLVDCLG